MNYIGKICKKHPELGGKRHKGSHKCTGCQNDNRTVRRVKNGYHESKRQQKRLRDLIINRYGGVCALCGETDRNALALDHIDHDGHKDKRKFKNNRALQWWLKKNDFPDGFRILCHNCNWRDHLRFIGSWLYADNPEVPVLKAIRLERDFQDKKYGPITGGGGHNLPEWVLLIESELQEAKYAAVKGGHGRNSIKHELIQVAALVFAALEQHGLEEINGRAF